MWILFIYVSLEVSVIINPLILLGRDILHVD